MVVRMCVYGERDDNLDPAQLSTVWGEKRGWKRYESHEYYNKRPAGGKERKRSKDEGGSAGLLSRALAWWRDGRVWAGGEHG